MREPVKTVPISYIRGLIVTQDGKCAISGRVLIQNEVNADHIIPLFRKELSPSLGECNIWLVHRVMNTMKGTRTYDELVESCKLILEHENEARCLLKKIQLGEIPRISKKEFDLWADQH